MWDVRAFEVCGGVLRFSGSLAKILQQGHDIILKLTYIAVHHLDTILWWCTFSTWIGTHWLHPVASHTLTFFFPSRLPSSPFYSLSLLVVTQIRGHIAGSSPPPTHYGSCLAFLSREDFSSFFLVDSRRIVLTHARRSQQLILFLLFLQIISKSRHGGIRTHGPTLLAYVAGNWYQVCYYYYIKTVSCHSRRIDLLVLTGYTYAHEE